MMEHSPGLSVVTVISLSVGRSVCKMYCGKMADWIRMPFGMVSAVGRGMDVLNGVMIVEEEGTVLGVSWGRPIVSNWDFATWLFPNYFDLTCAKGRQRSRRNSNGVTPKG